MKAALLTILLAVASTNRLAKESSPYLLLHAENPVDWYPWGDEAFQKARREDKPIFLSIGYSTCYWCHVMEREVFSSPEIAALMNADFVNIKVDREERPDLDEIYMMATQLITKSGGWPNSLFLTPELEPFFAGTYFPPEDREGRIGFPTLLKRLTEAWKTRREEVEKQADAVSGRMKRLLVAERPQSAVDLPPPSAVDRIVAELKKSFDSTHGGFGSAPKFPSPGNLYLLSELGEEGDADAARMVRASLLAMGRGAIYDHVDGGFHRYTLDAAWRVPHFEKMLYDNAHLGALAASIGVRSSDPEKTELLHLARGTFDWVLREMTLPEGVFKSAIDAETEGEEGAYYVWTAGELKEALGDESYGRLTPVLGFDQRPNFSGGKRTLYIARPPLDARFDPDIQKLRNARARRTRPRVDDKVLTDWNGMMIGALARAGSLLGEPRYVQASERAAAFLLERMKSTEGTLLHTYRSGKARIPAFLDDYAFLVAGLLDLHDVTGRARWLTEAQRLTDEMRSRLHRPEGGYASAAAAPDLLFEPQTITDGALPSGNAVTILNLLEIARRTGNMSYRDSAASSLRAFHMALEQYPTAVQTLALALRRYHRETQTLETLAREVVAVEAHGSGEIEVALTIRAGWHVNANPASSRFLIPTEVAGVANVRYPEPIRVKLGFSEEELSLYTGRVLIRCEAPPDVRELVLTYQACDETRCLPPVKKTVPLH